MKKSMVILCAVLLVFGVVGVASADLLNGLVAYYPFNGDANDASGKHHNGDVQGATLTSDRFGNTGNAYFFDGENDYIRVTDSPDFRLTSWTIAGWMNMVDYPPNINAEFIIGKPEDSNAKYNYLLVFQPSLGNVLSSQYETSTSEFDHYVLYSGLTPKQWYFFTSTRDQITGKHSLFVNGIEVDSQVWTDEPCANSQDVYIGGDGEINLNYFHGMIDDVRFYNRALSASDVKELYSMPNPVPEPATMILLASGLVGLAGFRKKFRKS